jgi:O-methyltransferase
MQVEMLPFLSLSAAHAVKAIAAFKLVSVASVAIAKPPRRLRSLVTRSLERLGVRDVLERFYWRLSPVWTKDAELVQPAEYGPALERIIAARKAGVGDAPFGDYLEFGVYNGRSMAVAYHSFRAANVSGARLMGFDSFEGMPYGEGRDDAGVFKGGQLYFDENNARDVMRRHGVDLAQVTLVKGWYDDTLTEKTRNDLGLKRLGIAMIDCVIYDSTCTVLRFIEPLIVDESILIFDDWACHDMHLKNQGQKRALYEWLGRHPDLSAVEIDAFQPHARVFRVERRGQCAAYLQDRLSPDRAG